MTNLLNVEGKEYTSAVVAAKQFGYTKDYLLLLAKDGKIDGRKVGNRWYVHIPSAEAFFKNAVERRKERRKEISLERKSELKSHARTRFIGSHRTAVLETLAIVVIGLSLGATGYVGTTAQQTAYVGEGAMNFIERFAISLYSFVSPRDSRTPVSDSAPLNLSGEESVGPEEGIVVFPEDDTAEKVVRALEDSFSDSVDVSVDPENPDTGIVVPKFKQGDGEAYRFLMVPVTAEGDIE